MLVYVILYAVILLVIGVIDFFKIKDFEDFAVAGKKQSQAFVVMSFMATMIGASATVGIMARVSSIGFPAFWWLAVGSIGLFLQSAFLSQKIRDLDANTLPNLVGMLTGRVGQIIVAMIIVISWPAIVASQIMAMSSIISIFTGKADNKLVILIVSIIVILYTTIGGQLSVVKTDAIQFIIIAVSFVGAFVYLFLFGHGDNQAVFQQIEFLNDKYQVKDFIIQIFIVGGAYLLGPDVVSRNLLAKDGKTAKKSSRTAGFILLAFSFIIVLLGLWVITNEPELAGANPLFYIITDVLPKPLGVLLAMGILSTILSSTDTCLVNISSIIENDILRRNKIWEMRLWAIVIGTLAVLMAFYNTDIIATLSGAYSVYTPGVVFPLLVAILAHGKRHIHKGIWIFSVVCGGSMGIISTYINPALDKLPLLGMGISLVISLLAVFCGGKVEKEPATENEATEE